MTLTLSAFFISIDIYVDISCTPFGQEQMTLLLDMVKPNFNHSHLHVFFSQSRLCKRNSSSLGHVGRHLYFCKPEYVFVSYKSFWLEHSDWTLSAVYVHAVIVGVFPRSCKSKYISSVSCYMTVTFYK
jgi:hypothetical protein